MKALLIVAIATCAVLLATLGTSTEKASAYWVCGPTAAVWRGPDFRCQHDTYRPTISYIEKLSSGRFYGVYRSATRGGSSISGSEYFSPTSDYYLQTFGCAAGYPNGHNLHQASITVSYTLAGSC